MAVPSRAVARRGVVRAGMVAGCAAGAALAAAALAGGVAGTIRVPAGPVGGLHLALDASSGLFLLVACVSAAAAALECERLFAPVAFGAAALALLAADGLALVLCFAVASVAAAYADPAARPELVRSDLVQSAWGALCLAAAMALLMGEGMDPRFAVMRAGSPEGARAAAVLVLAMGAAGSQLRRTARRGPVGVLLSGGLATLAAYVLVRVLLVLCGPALPGWCGLPLLAAGAALTVAGGLRANAENEPLAILAASRTGAMGLVAAGLGVALEAQGADLPQLAALALAGVLLHVASFAVAEALLVLCAAAAARGAGTAALFRFSGQARSVPGVLLAALVGAACLAGLPATAGFPGRWLLVQAVLAETRVGGWLSAGLAVGLAAMALGSALLAAAAVRLVGVGFLRRPRTPKAEAGAVLPRRDRLALTGLAACLLLIGAWPYAALAPVQAALRNLLGAGFEGRRFWVLTAETGGPGYAAPGIVALLALLGGALAWAARRMPGQRARRVPPWTGGAEGAPWLPPDGPATQCGAAAGQALLHGLFYPWRLRPVRGWAKAARERARRPGIAGMAGMVLLGLLLWLASWAA